MKTHLTAIEFEFELFFARQCSEGEAVSGIPRAERSIAEKEPNYESLCMNNPDNNFGSNHVDFGGIT